MKEDQRRESTSGIPIPQFMLTKTPLKKSVSLGEEIKRRALTSTRDDAYFNKDETEHLLAEGLAFPHGYPVSKAEEKALKKVRRRIKNKLSAQESRRRKKEYIEGLEKRVRLREKENSDLKQKVEKTEEKLRAMVDELFVLKQNQTAPETKKIEVSSEKDPSSQTQQPVVITSISRATQTGVCLQCYTEQWKTHLTESQPLPQINSCSSVVMDNKEEESDSNPMLQNKANTLQATTSLSDEESMELNNSSLDEVTPSSEINDGLLFMQLMRTGDQSPKYDASILSPT